MSKRSIGTGSCDAIASAETCSDNFSLHEITEFDLIGSQANEPDGFLVDCDYGLVGIAIEISRQRRKLLLELVTALDESNWTGAKELARRLCGE